MRVETPAELGAAIRRARRAQRLRLEDLALAAGTGVRFVSELERGKTTARLEPTLRVLHALGLRLDLEGPASDGDA
jgi:HTH-type transcriptional regulator/antitoxin HipB